MSFQNLIILSRVHGTNCFAPRVVKVTSSSSRRWRWGCTSPDKCLAPMRDRNHIKALKALLRQQQKRLLRILRLSRKWDVRRKAEYACVCLLVLAICIRFFCFPTPRRIGIPGKDSDSIPHLTAREGYRQNGKDFEQRREAELRSRTVCKRRAAHENIEELLLCGDFASSDAGKKIVGLVEVRNAEKTITPFLSALSNTVDSVVLIDDHSTDATRSAILEYNAVVGRTGAGQKIVEVLLNKSGNWIRDELLDRELLLGAGRRVGGSHFVVLDYDEYLSANCVENGLLRNTILRLNPGESLYLPWVEVWKSTSLQRVLPGDPSMNFLTRRQIAIFADDKKVHYTAENSVARRIGSNSTSQSGTIHVVRCPRTICPQPSRYSGQRSGLLYLSNVKHLDGCAIVEVRFLSMNNILLKSAWYEALGRVMGTKDGVTSGKMVRMLFPRRESISDNTDSEYQDEIPVTSVSSNLLDGYKDFDGGLYNQVETWRAKDLLKWIQREGASRFQGLEAVNLIDTSALRASVQRIEETGDVLYHVPRIKEGSLVIALDPKSLNVISKMLRYLNWSELQLAEELRSSAVRLSRPEGNLLQYEHWKSSVERKIQIALARSSKKEVFVSLGEASEDFQVAFLEILRNEFSHLHVTVVLGSWTPASSTREPLCLKIAKKFASEVGSHLRVLVVPSQSFGSFATLLWLRDTLTGTLSNARSRFSPSDDSALLTFAESVHENATKRKLENRLAPVARLIFSLNVGRSGSKYFSDILGSVNGVISANHEVACDNGFCSGGGAIRMQNLSLSDSYQSRASVKLPMIRSAVAQLARKGSKASFLTRSCRGVERGTWSGALLADDLDSFQTVLDISSTAGCHVHSIRDVVYAETNPNFKSWFYDVVLDKLPSCGYSVTVVVIRKYVAAILKSLYETGYFTSRDGYNWMETAAGVNSKVRIAPLQNDAKLDAYEKILSYVLASEARFRYILEAYGGDAGAKRVSPRRVRFIETRSEDLYSRNGTLELLRLLNLEPSSATDKLIGIVVDKYRAGTGTQKRRRMRATLRVCEGKVRQFVAKVRATSPGIDELFRTMDRVDGFEYPQ